MALKIPVTVELDDGRSLTVNCDQRDLAKAEAQEVGSDTRHSWVRFLAWSALTRTKQYSGTWQQFNETDCVEASDVQEEPAGADEGLDPGLQDPPAGS